MAQRIPVLAWVRVPDRAAPMIVNRLPAVLRERQVPLVWRGCKKPE
jgi:hypothetical protein